MPLESLDCPNCGAPLPDAGGRSIVVCRHCGSSIRIEAAPPAPSPEPRESRAPGQIGPLSPTVGEYGAPPPKRPERSALTSVTLGPADVAEVVRLLRDKQQLAAIQLYHAKVGGTLGEAKDAIEAIEAGLKDASAPLPPPSTGIRPIQMDDVYTLLRQGNRMEAIRRYREQTGVGLREAVTAIEGVERQLGRAPAARLRSASGVRSCLSVLGVIVIFFVCSFGGCGAYLQTKPIFRCALAEVQSAVVRQKLLRAPVRAGYLVLSPGFEESAGFDSWHLSAEYFMPVWGANGVGLAYVSVASDDSGRNAMSAKLYTSNGTFRLRDWGPLDCPASN
jgi:ribosomal protein L7/L12